MHLKVPILKLRRLTLSRPLGVSLSATYQDVVFELIPPTEKEQDTTDAICLEALWLAFHCDWLAHRGKNLAQFAPAVLKRSLSLIIFLR